MRNTLLVFFWIALLIATTPARGQSAPTAPVNVPDVSQLDQSPDNLALKQSLDARRAALLTRYNAWNAQAQEYNSQYANRNLDPNSAEYAAGQALLSSLSSALNSYNADNAAFAADVAKLVLNVKNLPIPTDKQTIEQIKKMVANAEKKGGFISPLDNEVMAEFILAESKRTGVPVWLIMAQAKRETTFGSPKNGTVQDRRTFTDGSTGNAHNLFNIRPGDNWDGKVLDLGKNSGQFRVYDSYEDSIKDYTSLMSGDNYRGKTLSEIAYKYFPPGDNGGNPATEKYIQEVIGYAAQFGVTATPETIPIPKPLQSNP